MYLPKQFEITDNDVKQKFINKNPFATVTTYYDDEYYQSFVPVIWVNGKLQFHLSKGNLHKNALTSGAKTVVTCMAEHGYVPTSWFVEERLVPTWNYMVVQVTGITQQIEIEDLHKQIDLMGEHYNDIYRDNWKNDLPYEFNKKLHNMIIGFELEPEKMIGKFKLSQNRSSESKAHYILKMKEVLECPYRQMIEQLSREA